MIDATVSARAVRVFVVAPPMASWGLERLIESAAPDLILAGSAATLAEAQGAVKRQAADVLVLDLDGGYDIEALEQLQEEPSARLLVLTSSKDVAFLDQAVVAGARGIVRKSDPPSTLLKAIERVHAGEFWIERSAAGRIFVELARRNSARQSDPDQARIATLTARERQMILAVASDTGAPGKVIASRLFISEHTLRNHLSAIYAKLGVANRVDLYAFATRHRLNRPG